MTDANTDANTDATPDTPQKSFIEDLLETYPQRFPEGKTSDEPYMTLIQDAQAASNWYFLFDTMSNIFHVGVFTFPGEEEVLLMANLPWQRFIITLSPEQCGLESFKKTYEELESGTIKTEIPVEALKPRLALQMVGVILHHHTADTLRHNQMRNIMNSLLDRLPDSIQPN